VKFSAPAFALRKSVQGVLTFSPSGRLLAQVTNRVLVWGLEQRLLAGQIKVISNEHFVAFNADDSIVAIKNTSGELAFCNPITTKVISETGRFTENRMGCQPHFSQDGAYLVDGDWNGVLMAWDPNGAREIDRRSFPDCMVTDIASCLRTGNFAVAVNAKRGSRTGSTLLLLPSSGGLADAERLEPIDASVARAGVLFRRRGWRHIEKISFSPNGDELAMVLGGKREKDPQSLHIINLTQRFVRVQIELPTWRHSVWSISWSQTGRIALVVKENLLRPGMGFQESVRVNEATDHEFVEIYSAKDLGLVRRVPFAGVSNAQFAPRSSGLAITSSETPGMYLQDDSMLPVVSRVAEFH
jgi:hypothetical protein